MESRRTRRERKGKEKEMMEEVDVDEGHKKPKAYEKSVIEEKACEFLKFTKQSDYKKFKQLNRTPTRILLLSLFLNSKSY